MKHLTNYDKVREFHTAFGHALNKSFKEGGDAAHELLQLRTRLIKEEYEEVVEALWKGDLSQVAKELADLLYVVYGTAVTYGIDLDTVFNRVHQSNMSKLGDDGKPVFRDDGKVMKGPNYQPPNFDDNAWQEIAETIR